MARIDDVRSEIRELIDRIHELKVELGELEKEEKSYYIGVTVVGDENYWDEWFRPLGFITTATAKKWLGDTGHSREKVFPVDEETYRNYILWYKVRKAKDSLEKLPYNNTDVLATISDLAVKERDIVESLGIEHPAFQHPGEVVYIREVNSFDDFEEDYE